MIFNAPFLFYNSKCWRGCLLRNRDFAFCSFSTCVMQILAILLYKAPKFPLSATFGTKTFFRGFLFSKSSIVHTQILGALRLIVRATEVSEYRQFKKKTPCILCIHNVRKYINIIIFYDYFSKNLAILLIAPR